MSLRAATHPHRRFVIFAAALSAVLACGGSRGKGGGGGGGSGTPAGGTTGDNNGGSASGAGPAGGTGGGTSGSGTAGAPSGGSGGSGSSNGAGATGGTNAGGGGSAGAGGSGGGGTAADPCAGLLPTFGADVVAILDAATQNACDSATSSASGEVALGTLGTTGLRFDLYDADGTPRNAHVEGVQRSQNPGALDPWFHPSAMGWHGVFHEPGLMPPVVLRAWDAMARVLATSERLVQSSAPTVDGGTVALTQWFTTYTRNGTTPPFGPWELEWFGADGASLRTAEIAPASQQVGVLVIQSWITKHVLVVDTSRTPWGAAWFGDDGAALTGWFSTGIGSASGMAHLKLLVDGRVAVSDGASWVAVLPDGEARLDAVPAWLASRGGKRLSTIRGGRGYAVLPAVNAGEARFELLTPDGQSCGTVNVPPGTPPAGQTWSPQSLFVGYDGTLFELVSRSGGTLDPSNHCAFRWWTGLLR